MTNSPSFLRFEGLANRLAVLRVTHRGTFHYIDVLDSPQDLVRVKQLDAKAFGQHVAIGLGELRTITSHGRVLALADAHGNGLLAASQILLQSAPGHCLQPAEAYCYGTAVHPDHQGRQIARILYKAQEVVAREAGKARMTLTVRIDNFPSLRARLRCGFRIDGYDPLRYSGSSRPSRLWMTKPLDCEPPPFEPEAQASRLRTGETPVLAPHRVERLAEPELTEVAFPVADAATAERLVGSLVGHRFHGTGLLRADEISDSTENAHLVFLRADVRPPTRQLAAPPNVEHDFGRLREVIVGYSPFSSYLTSENALNCTARRNVGNVDPIAFHDEHEAFVDTLRIYGVRTVPLYTPARDGQSGVFTRDPAFVVEDKLFLSNLRAPARQREQTAFRELRFDGAVVSLSEGGIVEGGDIVLPEAGVVFVGLGERTDAEGVARLRAHLPHHEFVILRHGELHLDTILTVLGTRLVLVDSARLGSDGMNELQQRGYSVIDCEQGEQESLACNVLALDDRVVLAPAENATTNGRLAAAGVDVIEVAMPNIIKKGGGPRCISCPTHRD